MDKEFKNNMYRMIEIFIEHPTKNFSIRELARMLKLNHSTVINHIGKIFKLGLIKKNKETLYITYYANVNDEKFLLYKKQHMIFKIVDCGIIDHIQKQTLASSIILFGSSAKGTFTEVSDIDIFVEAEETKVDLRFYENKLKRKVNLLFESNINDLSKELRNNIINGTVVYGFVKAR